MEKLQIGDKIHDAEGLEWTVYDNMRTINGRKYYPVRRGMFCAAYYVETTP